MARKGVVRCLLAAILFGASAPAASKLAGQMPTLVLAGLLYVGAARAARLTIARADQAGMLTTVAQVPTQNGARNAVVTTGGIVYLAHGGGVRLPALVVVSPAK